MREPYEASVDNLSGMSSVHSTSVRVDGLQRRQAMPLSLATIVSFMFLAAFGALAQTPAPSPAPAATAGGIGDYWWLIVVVLVVAVAAWYFMRGRTGTRI